MALWRLYCNTCGAQQCNIESVDAPVACPTCAGVDIRDICIVDLHCLLPCVYKQDGEPTLHKTEAIAMWEKTDTAQRYLVYRDSAENQQSVELD